MVNLPQSPAVPLSHVWPPPFTLGTYPACGGTGICDPGLVTAVMSSPEAACLYLLLVLHFSSLYPGLLRRKMREGEYRVLGIGAEGLTWYTVWLGRLYWEGDICLKTCKERESVNLSAGRAFWAEGTANAKALQLGRDWYVSGTAGHLSGWGGVNKWVIGEQAQSQRGEEGRGGGHFEWGPKHPCKYLGCTLRWKAIRECWADKWHDQLYVSKAHCSCWAARGPYITKAEAARADEMLLQ